VSQTVKLCAHVTLDVHPKPDDAPLPALVEVHGAATPYFGWDPELQADTPRLKCSTCGAFARVLGKAVRLRPTMAGNRA
jgi:hypothetical protein